MLYKFECNINDADYLEYNTFTLFNQPKAKLNTFLRIFGMFIALLAVFVYFVLRGYNEHALKRVLVIFLLWWAIYVVLMLLGPRLSFKSYIKTTKKNGKLPYSSFSAIEFYDNYFIEFADGIKTEVKYDAIYNIGVNGSKAIYLYVSSAQAYILPFSAFDSDDMRNEFIKFINEKTQKTQK